MVSESKHIDDVIQELDNYLEEEITKEKTRPYAERDDLEPRIKVYTQVREYLREKFPTTFNSVAKEQRTKDAREWSVDRLRPSTRLKIAFNEKGVTTIGKAIQYTSSEYLSIRDVGKITLKELTSKLKCYGLSLKGQ